MKSNRRFLLRFGFLAALTGLWNARLKAQSAEPGTGEDTDTVSLLTADGKLVRVASNNLPSNHGRRATNREVKSWMHDQSSRNKQKDN